MGERLRIEGVTVVGDGGRPILDRLDLDLDLQGVSVVAGPSGAGKTTLLRLCNRLEVPDRGRVLLDGVDVATMDSLALRRRVGMVFQRPALFPGTALDNLAVADPGCDADRGRALLAQVGLDPGMLDRPADQLSGGEAQRLCVARALLTRPEVLLADEPTSALDPDSRRRIEDLVCGLASEGLGVVWVTHDLDQARRLGGRIEVVVAGRRATADEAAAFLAAREEDLP